MGNDPKLRQNLKDPEKVKELVLKQFHDGTLCPEDLPAEIFDFLQQPENLFRALKFAQTTKKRATQESFLLLEKIKESGIPVGIFR